ncbi:MAG TPA: homoserine O-acetyltransferase [Cytophagaceae bacterium]|jgi:homoserine O-acetyltransferase|nr:homoserine O-acetyltransferase [Cytophagaceae bacterium]
MEQISDKKKVENKEYIYSENFILESGEKLPSIKIQYSTYGTFHKDKSKVVWICHALTANADPVSWWSGLVGDGFLYNPDDYFIVCANILGSCYGTSGPVEIDPTTGNRYYLSFPSVTIRDMVAAHELLRVHLGIEKIHTCIGGSLGGQQALEWSIIQPSLIDHLILMATNAFHSPWGIAFNEAQRMAIKADPTWEDSTLNAGKTGLSAARAMALLSYRTYETYCKTQSEESCEVTKGFRAITYQQYQGEKLVKRFNTHSYLYLTHAMDSHNVGRGRGRAEKALAMVKSKTLLVGIKSDILFPPSEQKYLQKHIMGSFYKEIDSLYGHDGFLIETDEIARVIRDFYKKG